MKGLFGDEIPDDPPAPIRGKNLIWKHKNRYRVAEGNRRCDNCKYVRLKQMAKNYYKCILLGCSSSESSDIRLKYVCNLHEYNIRS